jgi:fructose-1,6-bisphosphatase I
LINLSGLAGATNSTGDDQKKLDVIGNDIFISTMRSCGRVRILVSEEEDELIEFPAGPNAKYAVACDPIDGSSNLDAGVSVGTIFGIYRLADGAEGTKEDLLRPGTDLVAAGFTMYGASTQLVMTMKGGPVNGFTMDDSFGEFILTHPNMQMPKKRSIYSCNEGNSKYWDVATKEWVETIKNGEKPYSSRYIGSMVADAYRTLLYGGIFAYPADKKTPKGKLRILYECGPMAMVFEQGKFCKPHFLHGFNVLTFLFSQPAAKQSTATWHACSPSSPRASTTAAESSSAPMMRCSSSSTSTRSTASPCRV